MNDIRIVMRRYCQLKHAISGLCLVVFLLGRFVFGVAGSGLTGNSDDLHQLDGTLRSALVQGWDVGWHRTDNRIEMQSLCITGGFTPDTLMLLKKCEQVRSVAVQLPKLDKYHVDHLSQLPLLERLAILEGANSVTSEYPYRMRGSWLSETTSNDADIYSELANLRNLRVLLLRVKPRNHVQWSFLRTLSKLEVLDVVVDTQSCFTAEDVAGLSALREVTIRCPGAIPAATIDAIRSVTSAQQVALLGDQLDVHAFHSVGGDVATLLLGGVHLEREHIHSGLERIQRLDLRDCWISRDAFAAISRLTNLRELYLDDCKLGAGDNWQDLRDESFPFSSLTSLSCFGTKWVPIGRFESLRSIRSLSLVAGEDLAFLPEMSSLRSLHLQLFPGSEVVAALHSLRRSQIENISLRCIDIGERDFGLTSEFPCLKEISLSYMRCGFTGASSDSDENGGLERIVLDHVERDSSLLALMASPSVQELTLAGQETVARELTSVTLLPNLRALTVRECAPDQPSMQAALSGLSHLEDITFVDASIDGVSVQNLLGKIPARTCRIVRNRTHIDAVAFQGNGSVLEELVIIGSIAEAQTLADLPIGTVLAGPDLSYIGSDVFSGSCMPRWRSSWKNTLGSIPTR